MGYVYYKDKYQSIPYMNLGVVSGAGSVVSNVLDYSKWIKALINSSGPLSKSGHQAIKAGRTIVPDEEESPYTGTTLYSLGWGNNVRFISQVPFRLEDSAISSTSLDQEMLTITPQVYKGHELIQHSGGMEAFGTNLLVFPALKYGIIAFANTAETSNAIEEILMWHLVDEKLGIPKEERFDWTKR